MARIENHKYSIEEAFRECFYIVPDYQREYVWTDKEVHQLLEDIGEQIDAAIQGQFCRQYNFHQVSMMLHVGQNQASSMITCIYYIVILQHYIK